VNFSNFIAPRIARYLLRKLWMLISAACHRQLTPDEASQVHWLCNTISRGVQGRTRFNQRVEGLPLFVFSSGACDLPSPRAVGRVERELAALRKLLSWHDFSEPSSAAPQPARSRMSADVETGALIRS